MEGKPEDGVVDIESASSGSFSEDSEDEGSLSPEIDYRVHLEVSQVHIFFLTFLCILNILLINLYVHIKT